MGGRFDVGMVAAGRYEITRFIAAGGMGEVYAARDKVLDTEVALKTLRPELEGSSVALERFRREIGLARNATHPNVCRMFDVGEHEGHVFLTMELLEGSPLPTLLELERLEDIARQLVAGLGALHAASVVHRDFKTSNVIVVGDRAVITDFGLARSIESDGSLTGDAALLGTPAYMAPEQVEGRAATPASDVYALGVVLFELLTGKRPFIEETAMATAMARLTKDPPLPSSHRPDIPARWDEIVMRCLAREPEARPKLDDVLAPKCSRRRWPLAAVTAVALLAGGGAAAWQLRGDKAPLLADGDVVALMPVGDPKTLFADPFRMAMTIDIYELIGTAHVPVVDIHSRAMDLGLRGPAMQWAESPDPLAAAFAFPRVARVIQPMLDRDGDRAVLSIMTTVRDRTFTVRKFERPTDEVALLASDAARAIASDAGHGGVRFPDPPLTPRQYEAYGAGLGDLYRPISDEEGEAMMKAGLRRFTMLAKFSDEVPKHARSAALVADYLLARAEQADNWATTSKQHARGLVFAERALAADPQQAIAHAARAHAAMIMWDWKLADAESRRATELSTYARLGNRRKFVLQLVGRWDEMLEHHLREPIHDAGWTASLGYTYFYARRYDDCIDTLAPVLDTLDLKNFVQAISAASLPLCYSALGRHDEAVALADKLSAKLAHDAYARSALIPVYIEAGQLDRAQKLRDEIYNQGLDLGQQALIDDAFGDHDAALTKLEQVVAAHNVHASLLKIDRYSPALRAKPRFHALMQKVGFL